MIRKIEKCPACDSALIEEQVIADSAAWERYLAYSAIKYNGLLDEWFEQKCICIDRCAQCGHRWYRYQPDQEMLSIMYASGRRLINDHKEVSRIPTDSMRDEMRKLFELFETKPRPTLLDYGSGFGRWSRAAVSVGFGVTAYEPAVERGAEDGSAGFTVVHDHAELEGLHFDAVNLEQVLEHVPDPYQLLSDLRELCSHDTIVRITVPNILRCPEGRDLWKVWPYDGHRVHTMAPFEHLHGFTPYSLDRLLLRAGFKSLVFSRMLRHYRKMILRSIVGQVSPSLKSTSRLVSLSGL